jgi:hypothetical protein
MPKSKTDANNNLDLNEKIKYYAPTTISSASKTSSTTKILTKRISSSDMLFMPLLRRRIKNVDIRYLLAWLLSVIVIIWFMNSTNNLECNSHQSNNRLNKYNSNNIEYLRLQDDVDEKLLNNYDASIGKANVIPYNRNMPLIFVGGVPR